MNIPFIYQKRLYGFLKLVTTQSTRFDC